MRPESFEVPTPGGTLSVHHWQPARPLAKSVTVVTVHPWATLGGGEHNCIGTARLLAAATRVKENNQKAKALAVAAQATIATAAAEAAAALISYAPRVASSAKYDGYDDDNRGGRHQHHQS